MIRRNNKLTDSPLDMFQMNSNLDEIHLGQHVLAVFFECDPIL